MRKGRVRGRGKGGGADNLRGGRLLLSGSNRAKQQMMNAHYVNVK